jgi:hypothetical protein
MSLVSFHPEALNEFLESAGYYESQQPNLGQCFVDAVREFHLIARIPRPRRAGKRLNFLIAAPINSEPMATATTELLWILALLLSPRRI